MLVAEHLCFQYSGATRPVFEDVSLQLTPGTITILLGPSGAGKTTLLKTLAFLERPTGGRIGIDGRFEDFSAERDLKRQTLSPWPALTVVFQQLFLWPHLTLRQNILLPVRKQPAFVINQQLEELVELFHMEGFLDRYPNETSRGQQQRAALARALMLKPRYILCDEITSALDVEQVSNVLECLQRTKERNVGILAITHQLRFARKSADQVLFLDRGRLIEKGDITCLDKPQTPRLAEFLGMIAASS